MKPIGLTLTAFLICSFLSLAAQEKNFKPGADGIYKEVEIMPEFKGGFAGLQTYLMENIKYPEKAKKEGITGKVIVQFVIDEKGKVNDTKVLKSADPLLDAEAVRVVQGMPDWIPGKHKGEAVKVYFTLPVAFALK
jgi:TonB family protein